jgi:hypothetical protein
MSNTAYPSSTNRPGGWVWAPILACLFLCWPLICCCCLVLGIAGWIAGPPRGNAVPETQNIPPVVTIPALPGGLDPAAEPLFGSVHLQRGFTPDPYPVELVAGGRVDTSALEQDCGFTSSPPAFSFRLSGGASETFLRIFFSAYDNTATTLLVHTPQDEWLCEDGSFLNSGKDPVMDFQFAPSGQYDIWVGTRADASPTTGTLLITQSMDVTP